MSVPITGLFLLPLGLVIVLLPWRICLIGLVTFAMMSPAAVINIGSFGLQPGYYMLLLLVGRTAAEIMVGGYQLNAFVLSRMRGLVAFIAVVFLVLFIALCFFQGKVQTLPGTSGFNSNLTHPFHLVRENITQIAYVLMNTCLVYCMAHQGARRAMPALFRQWDTAMVCGLCFAAAASVGKSRIMQR